MRTKFDENELSIELNIWSPVLYKNENEFTIDVYYNDHGHPKYVHDEFGADVIKDFRLALVNEISSRNSTDDISRVHTDAFAILSKETNCGAFKMDFRGIPHNILKKTIQIKTIR